MARNGLVTTVNMQNVLRRWSRIVSESVAPYGAVHRKVLYNDLMRDLVQRVGDFRNVKGMIAPEDAQACFRRLYEWFIEHHVGDVHDRVAFDAAYAFIEAFFEEAMENA